jgi:uncharacterized membrane protein YgcG
MDLKITALAVILFFVLSPTVLVRLPSSGNKYVVAAVHALIFGLLFHLAQTFTNTESFEEGARGGGGGSRGGRGGSRGGRGGSKKSGGGRRKK